MPIPINTMNATVGTVAFWRSCAPHYGVRKWRSAMERFALQHGKAIAHLGNDGAIIIERDPIEQSKLTTYRMKPEEVTWHCGIIPA